MTDSLKIVDVDDDTVVSWNFYDQTGTNPNGVKCKVRSLDWGEVSPGDDLFPLPDAGTLLVGTYDPPVEATLLLRLEADSYTDLAKGTSELARLVRTGSGKALRWLADGEASSERRYVDWLNGAVPDLLSGHDIARQRLTFGAGVATEVTLKLLRQPYARGVAVTVGPTTVPNDPADTNGRYLRVPMAGTAPTPAVLKVKGDTGSKIQEVRVGVLSGTDAILDDYEGTAGTHYCKLNASHDGWTIALSNDTATTADADASGGNAAQTTYASNPTVMAKRARATRTTKLDSLRGTWDVYGRMKATVDDEHIVQLRYGPSTADPTAYSLDEVTFEPAGSTSFSFVDVYLGRIAIPSDIALGGVAFELWSRSEDTAARLRWSSLSFVPVEGQAVLSVPGESTTTLVDGDQLATPVTNPAGGTAGMVVSAAFLLDTTTDNAGIAPNTGTSLLTGTHKCVFRVENQTAASATIVCRVRNISDSADWLTTTVTVGAGVKKNVTLEGGLPSGTNAAGDVYQAQVDDPSAVPFKIHYITYTYVTSLGINQSVRTDPERNAVEKLDSSDNLLQPLAVEGRVPLWLQPGENTVYLHYGDVKVDTNAPGLESKLTRDCAVSATFAPRYFL